MYDNVRKPESDWYEAGYTAPRTDAAGTGCYDSYWSPSQAAAPKKKSHQGLKITMIILGVLVLIIASCYVFAGRGRDSISVDGEPGQHGSVTLPREDTDDDTTVTGKNELPAAPTDPSVTMTLQPAGGSALSLQSVYAKCLPSVVGIHADISRGEYSTGTGVVLTSDGYIVTNTHVLDGAKAVTVTTSDGTEYSGKLVGISASKDKQVSLSAKSGGASGNLDVREGTLGSRKLADNALIYVDGELKSLSELTEVIIPQSQIIYARTNSSGQIDLIALSGTGDGSALYGRVIKAESRADGSDISGGTIYNQFITIDLGGGKTIEKRGGYSVQVGDFVAAVAGESSFTSVVNLTKFSKVSTSAWVGTTAINYGGRTYNVSSGVLIWNRDGQSWFTGGVDAAISYGGTMNLYVKDGIVRAIEIGG